MTRNEYEQHGLEYYASKMGNKDVDGAKEMSVQSKSSVKECNSSVANNYLVLCGMKSI